MVNRARYRRNIYSILVELALIVIGVLTAITVENYRQSLQERKAERDYLIALRTSVQADTAMLNREIQKCFLKRKAGESMLRWIREGGPADAAEFEQAVQSVIMGIDPFYSTAIFEDLRASGNLKLIHDEQLRNSVINYYLTIDHLGQIHHDQRAIISYNTDFTDNLSYEEFTFQEIDQVKVLDRLRKDMVALAYLARLQKRAYTAYSSLLFTSLPTSLDLLDQLNTALEGEKMK